MSVLWPLYMFLREVGQFAPIVVLFVAVLMWKNDLKHCAEDITWIKEALMKHLEWHSETKD